LVAVNFQKIVNWSPKIFKICKLVPDFILKLLYPNDFFFKKWWHFNWSIWIAKILIFLEFLITLSIYEAWIRVQVQYNTGTQIREFYNSGYDTAKVCQQKFYTKTYMHLKYLNKTNINYSSLLYYYKSHNF